MISININSAELLRRITQIQSLDTDRMTKEQATTVNGMMHTRIFENGRASDGSQIGTYSEGYMKIRTGNYGNSSTHSKGKNKGKPKDSGTYTRGSMKGQARPKYNVGNDTKVILSLTREMQMDMNVTSLNKGYGIGFLKNPNRSKGKTFTHMDIAMNAERVYGKKIFSMSNEEQKGANAIAERYINEALK
jgi:hypothetical protein